MARRRAVDATNFSAAVAALESLVAATTTISYPAAVTRLLPTLAVLKAKGIGAKAIESVLKAAGTDISDTTIWRAMRALDVAVIPDMPTSTPVPAGTALGSMDARLPVPRAPEADAEDPAAITASDDGPMALTRGRDPETAPDPASAPTRKPTLNLKVDLRALGWQGRSP